MRKISLTDGRMSVEILPDCGGAISALRWLSPGGKIIDLLRPAQSEDILTRNADQMSCIPISPVASPTQEVSEWIVQDASNIRATLTLHTETHENAAPHSGYQLLQRFRLGLDGLSIQYTLTNIGVNSMFARIGLRLRPDWRGNNVLRGTLMHMDAAKRESHAPSCDELAAGYRLSSQDIHACLRYQGKPVRYEWPEERLALVLGQLTGFEYVGVTYKASHPAIRLSLLSHPDMDSFAFPGTSPLQRGDSLSATLLLSAAVLAA